MMHINRIPGVTDLLQIKGKNIFEKHRRRVGKTPDKRIDPKANQLKAGMMLLTFKTDGYRWIGRTCFTAWASRRTVLISQRF
jgi:hypothetical protein